ncbi:flagellin N-terminal helical domain-containing protein [Piscirickettsia litoralis]|uniref:Flagellin n=1 Tax=Piscirickettsia litoralis TaxID=1891921 RepID=A0ABX3A4G7_9GAMM|nr:flagellin [Piscirickettsia litoralis]ODN43756.1 B-type flagellin [Piscirickettsia litoralis]
MALSVVTNFTSLVAQNRINETNMSLQTTLQRLATGKRINSAADDAAGYAIAARQSTDIMSFGQAARNANDGISVVQTASSAINTNIASLQRMRVLALQSLNGTNSSSDRVNLDLEFQQLASSITETANSTKFNGQSLLDGSFAGKNFQVGVTTSETISMSFADSRATAIGDYKTTAVNAGAAVFDFEMASTGLGIAVLSTAQDVDNAILASSDLTIVGHLGTKSLADADFGAAATSFGLATATTTSAGMSAAVIAKAVNDSTGDHGVTASAETKATLSALTAAGDVTFSLGSGTGSVAADYNFTTITATIADTSDLSALAQAINDTTGTHGVVAELSSTDKGSMTLISSSGQNISLDTFDSSAAGTMTLTEQDGTAGLVLQDAGGNDSFIATGIVEYHSSKAFTLTSAVADIGTTTADAAGFKSVDASDIKTTAAAKSAIFALDEALNRLTDSQANNGAIENRLGVVISNLESQQLNTTNSRGRIEDADFASETAQLSKLQILSQVGTAMLAQANQIPAAVLSLI